LVFIAPHDLGSGFNMTVPHTARDDALLALNRWQQGMAEVSASVMSKP
jgi:hypothetical protein